MQAWCGLWHSVLPGQLIRVVVVRRDATRCLNTPGQRKPLPVVEAFFTTDLTLSLDAILREYRDRWAVEIAIRDANAFDGLGQEQCRKWHRIVSANTFRLVMTAARTLWFMLTLSAAPVCLCAAIGPGTDRKWRPANWMWCGPVERPCMRLVFFPYHGSSQSWLKMMRSLNRLYVSQRRARN